MRRLALTCLSLLALSKAAAGGPSVEVSHDEFDFGKTVQRAVVTHDFWIKSTGDDTLIITNVVPGCGCTKSWVSDSTLAPGDSTNLHIVFSTGYFRGHVAKRPYIETNASADKVYVKIHAELEVQPQNGGAVAITPPVVDVSQFDERPRRRARFFIENRSDRNLNISVADSSFKSFSVKVPDKVKAGESVEALITVFKEAVATDFEESLTLEFDDALQSRFTVPIKRLYRAGDKSTATGGK
ncbi:MAG TPA: DUF1573 domain-containing protein [Acidobacteriota bacterium]|nr:DUF1573 domain-containing protein [Acidobacteriota bacterium]